MMRKFFIKIDLESIKINPRAGETRTVIPGVENLVLSGMGDFKNLEKIKNFDGVTSAKITTYFNAASGLASFEAIVIAKNPDTIEDIKKYMETYKVGIEQQAHVIDHNPLPKWIYEYIDIRIICPTCMAVAWLSEVHTRDFDEDQSAYIDVLTCLKCKAVEHVDIAHETIDEALKRLESRCNNLQCTSPA